MITEMSKEDGIWSVGVMQLWLKLRAWDVSRRISLHECWQPNRRKITCSKSLAFFSAQNQMQIWYEKLSLATEHGSKAMIPKQRPSQQFGNLLHPHGQRKIIKFEARQKYCS